MAFELRQYQDDISTKAVAILLKWRILYLGMEVRTGKTFCMLATVKKFSAQNICVITVKKAIPSIRNDYETMNPSFEMFIINFESIHKISPTAKFDLYVIDEADSLGQYPKPSNRTEKLKKIIGDKPVILMSGTPNPETPSQLYHQFWISANSPWAEFTSFYAWARAGYVKVAKRFISNKEFNDYSGADEARIKEETGHLFLTYSQEEAGFKQKVQEIKHYVQMKASTYNLAKKILIDQVYVGRNGDAIVADTAVKVQQKVHQIYSGSCKLEPKRVKLPDGTFTIADAETVIFDTSKVDYILHNFPRKKLAIFYKFVAEGDMLKRAFASNWTDDPEAFNKHHELNFICQISSGKQGVNLSTADLQIMFNPDFSANSYWQGRARQVTKEREKEIIVIWLLAVGGIEEKIYQSVMDKKDYTLGYFKRDFMPWLKGEKVLLTKAQAAAELTRAEMNAAHKQQPLFADTPPALSVPWAQVDPLKEFTKSDYNNFDDPFK